MNNHRGNSFGPRAASQGPDRANEKHTSADTRIKKGEVRNPYGRSGKPRVGDNTPDFTAQLRERLLIPIKSSDGRRYSFSDVIANTLIKRASEGDLQAVKIALDVCRQPSKTSDREGDSVFGPEQNDLLIERALERLAAKRNRPQMTPPPDKDGEGEDFAPDAACDLAEN